MEVSNASCSAHARVRQLPKGDGAFDAFFYGLHMHYYKRHLGDYAKKAGHLSPLEHGVYTLILDSYYDREQAPTLTEAMRWARARNEDEKSAVLAVLDEFFTLENDRYSQKRVDEELAEYHSKAETNRVIAVAREKKKRERKENEFSTNAPPEQHEPCTNRAPHDHQSCTSGQPNHKPLTINQEPVSKVKPTVTPSGETLEVFDYWQKKLNHPQAKLDSKREKAIKGRLKDGYTVGQLCQAIDGCSIDPFSQGKNDRQAIFDDIELICRNGPKVDQFIRIAERGPANGRSQAQNATISNLQRYLEENP